MKKYFLLIIVLILPLVAADDIYNRENLDLSIKINGTVDIIPQKADYKVEDMSIYLSFFPKENKDQKITSLITNPSSEQIGEERLFHWKKITEDKIHYSLETELNKKYSMEKVKTKQNFPIRTIDDKLKKYTEETGTIQISQEIEELANSLAQGEDDLYVVAHKFAKWVNQNIEYKITPETKGANQKSSWVMENRIGVCGEFASLFIAMCRSVGIPARFVSGVAYTTDHRLPDNWNSHAWAEIHFPEYGWVPFDLTYGEFGYSSPAHIRFSENIDSNMSRTLFEWKTKDAEIITHPLDIQVDILGKSEPINPLISIDSKIAKKETGPGSYNLLEINLKNENSFYVPTEISISRTDKISFLEGHRHHALMKPDSEKSLYLIFNVKEDLDEQFKYSFRIKSYTKRNSTSYSNLTVTKDYPHYSKGFIEEIIQLKEEKEEKNYTEKISFDCEPKKQNYLVGEKAEIICSIENIGNTLLENIKVCLEDECKHSSLGISRKEDIEFTKKTEKEGQKRFQATLQHNNIRKKSLAVIDVFDRPRLEIEGIKFPEKIRFDESFRIEFTVSNKNKAPVKSTKVSITGGGLHQVWETEAFSKETRYVLNVDRHVLNYENNMINLAVKYTDEKDTEYIYEEKIQINVTDLTLGQKTIMFSNRAQDDIIQHRDEWLIILFGSVIVCLIVLRFILGPRSMRLDLREFEKLDPPSGKN